jgi:uracil phosphoribosyltransferase
MLELVPSARVGHIGLYREPRSLEAIEYYLKMPEDLAERDVILVDPMLATGNSAVAAISQLSELGARAIKFVCLVAAPEGVAKLHQIFPDITIITAALDRRLDDHGYILPGLGDAGDRLFGTK